MLAILSMGRWVNSAKMGVDDVRMYTGYLMLDDENIGWEFYHDMQISWPDSGSPPIKMLES